MEDKASQDNRSVITTRENNGDLKTALSLSSYQVDNC